MPAGSRRGGLAWARWPIVQAIRPGEKRFVTVAQRRLAPQDGPGGSQDRLGAQIVGYEIKDAVSLVVNPVR
jgi:hypothetical protein